MKSAKIILVAIALFATVGGAFALKAQRGLNVFCTTTSTGVPVLLINATFSAFGSPDHYCTVPGTSSLVYTAITFAD